MFLRQEEKVICLRIGCLCLHQNQIEMCDILTNRESAEIDDMKSKIRALEERQAVINKITPYKRGGNVVVHDITKGRYVIRLPRALQSEQEKVTAESETEVYHRAYVLLCESSLSLESVYERAMCQRDSDKNVEEVTQKRTRQLWTKWFSQSDLVHKPIKDIKASELTALLRRLTAGHSMTRTTYTNIKSILNLIYDYAVEHDLVEVNAARQIHISSIKFKPQGSGTYTDEMRSKVLEYIETNDKLESSVYYAAIYVMFHLCCRIGEIKALRWSDYDVTNGTLYIHREVVKRNGKWCEVDHTKSSETGNRKQYLSPKIQRLLNEMKKDQRNEYIFPTEQGLFLNTSKFNDYLKDICGRVGISYMSSHKIRFWSVTALVRQTGGDITAVGSYAGQKNRQTTLHYIRAAQDEDVQRKAAAAVYG